MLTTRCTKPTFEAKMTDRKMIIGMHLGSGYGSQSGAWRMAHA